MAVPWTTVRHALVAALSVLAFALFTAVGFAEGGAWGPVEGLVLGTITVAAVLVKTVSHRLSAQRLGAVLGLFALVNLCVVAANAYATGESIRSDAAAMFAAGLAAALALAAWPSLSNRAGSG